MYLYIHNNYIYLHIELNDAIFMKKLSDQSLLLLLLTTNIYLYLVGLFDFFFDLCFFSERWR